MKILTLDTSGITASVAVVCNDGLLAECTVNCKVTHSQTLFPMIDNMMKMIGLGPGHLDAVAIAKGAGSFTGTRIGVAAAKGLGLALDIPIIGVPTVDALAYNLYGTERMICPMMDVHASFNKPASTDDKRAREVYTGIYTFEGSEFIIKEGQMAVSVEEIIEMVNGLGTEVIFLGDGASVNSDRIGELARVPYTYAPLHLSRQRAGAVGALAVRYYEEGRYEHADAFVPTYLKLSQAERERLQRQEGT